MAMERRNPLPAGRYWIQLPPKDAPSFDAWRAANKGKVHSRATSTTAADGWTWYLFDTTAPLMWDAAAWGFPTVADASVRSETDVLSLPDPQPGWVDSLDSAIEGVGRSTLITVGVIAVAAIVLGKIFK
jgi:hypothetical protein